MRILVVTPVAPAPADSGSRIRVARIVEALRRRHEVAVLCLEEADAARAGAETGVPVWIAPARPVRGLAPVGFDGAVTEAVWAAARRFGAEALHVEKTAGAAAVGLHRRPPPLPVVLDEACVHHVAYRREAALARGPLRRARGWLRWRRLRRFERGLARAAWAHVAVSEDEAALLRRLAPAATVVVAPNGVDVARVRPTPPGTSLLFVGLLGYAPNRDAVAWLCREVLPRLGPDAPPLLVAGRDPGPALLELAAARPGVRLLGFVPDLAPVYAEAAVFVNPMRGGGGTRLKVLEAMAAGKAVVSTTVGAEGLAVTPGRDIVLADEPGPFAAAVRALLADRGRAAEIGRAARALVEARYRWETCLGPLEALYARLAAAREAVRR